MGSASADGVPLSSVAPGWTDAAGLDAVFEDKLAKMDSFAFDELVTRVRPPQESDDPRVRAADAIAKELGARQRGRRKPNSDAARQAAADAMRQYATGR